MTRPTSAAAPAPSPAPSSAAAPAFPPAQRPGTGRARSFAALRTIAALMLREMSTRYGRTPGGYLWAVLEPLAAILFLSVGFSLVIRNPSLGTSFLLFYATGFLPFNLYQSVSNTVARALSYSRPLLRYPAVTWIDALLARFLLNSLTGILVTLLLTGAVLAVIDSRAVLDLPPAVLAMFLAMILGLGVGALNCVLSGLFPLWEVAWSILTRPLFIASGILFIYEDLPPLAQDILWFNPLIHITGLMRTGFYPTYTASYASVPFVLLSSLGLLALGLVLTGRYHRDILNR
ncbi:MULTISPECIES: ABC transporter permease [unclassified Leisingera]|uniref:ABC transporter permease n=1 Tax=unclassified Leisingera TaxID=2614906 RepID=UPI0002F3FCD2|nr:MULTISPECIES: ABC transporter permease [unclassified Leisingera]KIC18753.1 sugar ABC transporter permease [Leisingera sp. ANG-DT]KIC23988.1 sugar ABC transporter permease [Leisingera sp. ANG-S3]KIC25813.1 sugar ABC transporter permease [Leisingera sp. ANG-M6]KIC28721.1 sugar ABC transporter permease [Leisingera sp. ANG-S5]KIC52613.1 sugar ABC transporter permease [Leisingera sp. ANG-S]